MAKKDLVLLGQITAPHGVRGLVKVRSYTEDPAAIADYGPLRDPTGREFRLINKGLTKGGILAAIDGVNDRDGAEALRGTKLHVPRDRLPSEDNDEEFYHVDLINLSVEQPNGEHLGRVRAVQNFGAGDVLEIAPAAGGPTLLLPFTRAMVPTVDIDGGKLVVGNIADFLAGEEAE